MTRLARLRRRLRRAVLARRRLLAAILAGFAVLAALRAVDDPPPAVAQVQVAARDLPAGTVLAAAHLVSAAYDPELVPAGVSAGAGDLLGRTTAAPLRRGEPVTDVRLLGAGLLASYPGRVAVPVRIGDSAAVDLLTVGDVVDLVAADPRGDDAAVVASGAAVVAIPPKGSGLASATAGGLVVVAVPVAAVRPLVRAAASAYVSPVLVG